MPSLSSRYSAAFQYNAAYSWIEGFGYGLLCFFLPFVISHAQQQLLLGTIVNAALVLAAVRLEWQHCMPVILLPSLGVIAAGVLFGPFTIYLVYLMPFIWAGNTILVLIFKRFKEKSFALRAVGGAALKASFLGFSSFVLFLFSLIPQQLLFAMSAIQLLTALAGSAAAFFALKILPKRS